MKVVLDTSCVIILSQIEKMDILKTLFSKIFVPEAVFAEFMIKAVNTEDEKKFKKIIKTVKVKDFFCCNDSLS